MFARYWVEASKRGAESAVESAAVMAASGQMADDDIANGEAVSNDRERLVAAYARWIRGN
jgi:hypothetical protein